MGFGKIHLNRELAVGTRDDKRRRRNYTATYERAAEPHVNCYRENFRPTSFFVNVIRFKIQKEKDKFREIEFTRRASFAVSNTI